MSTRSNRRVDTYVALGSSSTSGAGASDPASKGYVALLARGLNERFPDLELLNLGASRTTLKDMLQGWDEVVKPRPSIVTVLPFTDYAKTPIEEFVVRIEDFMEKVERMVEERIREGSFCHVFFGDLRIDPTFVAGANDKRDAPSYRPSDYAMLTAKNEVLGSLVAAQSTITLVPIIDQNAIHPEWIGPSGHPNDLGHGYIAGCFRKAIDRWWSELELDA